MKVFLSWSGEMSRELAEALRDWLPSVLQSVKPFFTPSDIEKGARWSKDIAQELDASTVGIFCLTKENLTKPWIMFEAGALSKNLDVARVCPILFGVDNAELQGPLVQFQASPFTEGEMRKLVRTLNLSSGEHKLDDSVLSNVFTMWWPTLQDKVNKILQKYADQPSDKANERSDRELIEEILQLTRLGSKAPRRSKAERDVDSSALKYAMNKLLALGKSASTAPIMSTSKLLATLTDICHALEFTADELELGVDENRAEFQEWLKSIEIRTSPA
jgi:hypothetical protein